MDKLLAQSHPDLAFDDLEAQCGNTRSKKSLTKLHEVCRTQKMGKSTDFTLPVIGRLSAAAGGPGYTTIRTTDVQARRYQTLISVWANYSGGYTSQMGKPRQKDRQPNLAERLVKYNVDPVIVAAVGRLESDYKKTYNALNLMKNKGEIVIDRRKSATPESSATQSEVLPAFTLSELERKAVRQALSEDFLKDEGWTVDSSGRIKNDKGRPIFAAGFATALRKITERS